MSGIIQLARTASAVAEGALRERVPVSRRTDANDRLAETVISTFECPAIAAGRKDEIT